MKPEIRSVAETGSTNDDLMALAREGAGEGLWLRADVQTTGRGRQGRDWTSPKGNLYTSTLVRLKDGDPPPASLAMVAAIALFDTALSYLPYGRFVLKWPNDLMLDGAKVSGILLEREGDAVVVGMGLNLASHPTGLDRPVTSLAAHGGHIPPDIFIADLAPQFARVLDHWRSNPLSATIAQWQGRAHAQGTPLTVHDGGGDPVAGVFDGLNEDGALRLRLEDGEVRVIHAGDVFLV
ncbi:biotin--[acetyl-CoA-carboxylase] ligase [uncultured Parasphingopyxis sp.]|uniref:biotin--[acetyl-CoA-carboxylase] ligase n=1 Tax=uncultured Parasphingopyxis sp. TaxID=1547918 RepID=UPI00261CD367|nr:biotin--[acetyl-CoA-carboxylase] ligase [uncultured Parasphingopyxis sp.]